VIRGRTRAVLLAAVAAAQVARAACPADCIGGGKIAATDCFVEFGGVVATDESCTDGNPSCDMDGVVNGACVFPLSVCLNVAGDPRCAARGLSAPPTVAPAKSPVARALAQAVGALDPTTPGCTPAGLAVPLAASLNGIRPGVVRLVITGKAGRRRDRNAIRLTCRPSPIAPSLANVVAPIFQSRCAIPACHAATPGSVGPLLDASSDVRAALVAVPSVNVPSLQLVRPGSVTRSYLARKVLGRNIPDHTPRMPQGCPKTVPAGGCLTDAELAAIVAWIQTGAPGN
jgi:hypothetical protein